MKRTLQLMLAIMVVGMFMVTPVAAATSQGLEWGIVTGDRFDYTLTSTDFNLDEEMFVNITGMPALAIPDPISTWGQIPFPDLGFYWANETSLNWLEVLILFFGLATVGSRFAVPAGNFSLLQSLLAPVLSGEDYPDSTNVWGVEWSEELTPTEDITVNGEYSRVDGFLTEYRIETVSSLNDSVLSSTTLIRDNIPPVGIDTGNILQLLQDNILYIAIGVGVLLVLVIVCKKR